ncbi:polysaccharide biosynthesis protein [Eoetvoesiella caeni]|uniref:FlaA1/EpsC-like NDP-sugar epimerase n=1 Tax=Eoetvoesiella caeni TaxID=645616 RepID=A0A366HIF8_9BURK|nr:nucleoside-diphosphate sugar epimerase/dehydratase [Eoetvoesiella caeni]MCI2807790.1 polysaccharide biosynthesis protein [Eoetvoesiella caeni]NYT54207.1 polysaccharide biosynthesis protein [Eoetvoesiella caeni]RBP41706.1 FlaA1/EpsC-like NDP-sugar epimerase [Eoetvoesiella caeni]
MGLSTGFRSTLVFLFDVVAVLVAWAGAFLIRFNFDWPIPVDRAIWVGVLPLVIAQLIACRWAGLYRGMWIFASLPDLKRVLKAVFFSGAVLLLLTVLVRDYVVVPRSIVLLYPLLLLLIMGGGRAAWRMWKEYRMYGDVRGKGKPVVVVGAGTAGAMLVRELGRSAEWQVVALADDDRSKWGLEISGRRVEGGADKLVEIMRHYNARHVILAMPSARAEVLQRITKIASEAGAHLFTVPGLGELMSGRVAINMMRPVKIEDLLGRESVHIDNLNVQAMLTGKRILVTGAGGSIGSELCRQLSRFSPACIVLFESSEFALYMIEQWFMEHRPEIKVLSLAGDVKDKQRLIEVFTSLRPHVVFHAAAYKHVPLMEVGNAWQAVRNNVLGTLNVARCAQRFGTERFVLISTDKAVNPTNVMGATKRLAEMVCEVLHCHSSDDGTRFQMVRFGNVLGSTGSVIPKFQAQIAHGGPVTVTDPEITRYFMSIPEAAQLVLQAAAMGNGGEVFVLDMGEPVKIVDMARNMIRLSGFTEDDIRIEFTGLRPGEKLYEELLADSEETLETPHPKLRIVRSRSVSEGFYSELQEWLTSKDSVSDDVVRDQLKHWIPEYKPMKI